MAFGWLLEATYESGYVLREDEQDCSPYEAGRNVFHAILTSAPEKYHGPMVRYSLVGKDERFDIDWAALPSNARPIYYREMERSFSPSGGWFDPVAKNHYFGYQFNNETGACIKEVKEIPADS